MKDKDYLKMSFSEKTRDIATKVSAQKNSNNTINYMDIRALKDLEDLQLERTEKINKKISKIKENNKTNQSEIKEIENEIKKVSKQIMEMNEKKRLGLEEAMETRDKWISITLKKPSVWSKTKRFFSNRFNTINVISKTVIEPLKMRVQEFRVNELKGLKE